ncbi:MAG: single-stranded DNA-binding protein [Dehalococcoidia bacterium]|nr:single-stranded DNA-binding protein [Dehalococcoidia bacterium]MCA9844253.1 single-stranded DNA-binding protein [Dehalococcoidia bacterium]MCA9853867.1 single-stranded DNA-binding protein [Dehalococcoidia bacterium]
MANLNKVMLIGNTGRDAEMRYTANGNAMATFSMAVNSNRRNPAGEWETETEWFNVVMFGDSAERQAQYITKGKQIYVEGRLRTRNWDDDQGQRHYRTEVIANSVQFLDRRSDSEGGGGGGSRGGDDGWGDSYSGRSGGGGSTDADDLPFE